MQGGNDHGPHAKVTATGLGMAFTIGNDFVSSDITHSVKRAPFFCLSMTCAKDLGIWNIFELRNWDICEIFLGSGQCENEVEQADNYVKLYDRQVRLLDSRVHLEDAMATCFKDGTRMPRVTTERDQLALRMFHGEKSLFVQSILNFQHQEPHNKMD